MSWRDQASRFLTLLRALTYRDLKARYARSTLGVVWIFGMGRTKPGAWR